MNRFSKKKKDLKRRHLRLRSKVVGTPERPRLSVYRSLRNVYVQIIDDVNGVTLASASTKSADFAGQAGGNVDAAKQVGKLIADKAKEKQITSVVFDRGGRKYHGRVKALADAARENGLQF